MIARNLKGVEFMVCNTDAQHLSTTLTDNRLQLGRNVTEGLGCGANPDLGRKVREIFLVIAIGTAATAAIATAVVVNDDSSITFFFFNN